MNNDEDLLPYKAVLCVWDTTQHNAPPSFVLTSAGHPTCCTFSSSQSYLLLGGTEEGSLHLWDLRESSSIHKDRDAVDLGIERGIRKPCFSTPTAILNIDASSPFGDDQHAAPITQIEAIGEYEEAVTSQFASLDRSGLVCLWVSTSSSRDEDLGLSPWSQVSLVLTRALRVGSNIASTWDIASGLSTTSHLTAVPGDVSTLLAAAPRGVVNKVVRFGDPPRPSNLERQVDKGVEIIASLTPREERNGVSYYSDVTCVSPQSTHCGLPQLVLVGRSDGTVDMFQMDVSVPLQTWSTDQLLSREKSENTAVSIVKWLPNKPTCFIIVDALGNMLLFDLLLDAHMPICTDKLPAPLAVQASQMVAPAPSRSLAVAQALLAPY